ncbi:UrcA family protein [Altererythrobacter atlanticus]|uniref:Uncharacterized protein n=1 Tax=Croceibacterium atlanticum TaxID=1267766 RepID=A0A0F7KTE6_9SPHN|nr:UrcA family protein [Croceibacterium atlanticum]AKH42070.1 hypothetical protein WYH_01022 [Croceibacterium atlanticum]MBB5733361.1 UrcA family protein [Croceibacterium atlanticum]
MKTIALKAALVATLSALTIAPVAAQDVTQTIELGDIDINSAEGMKELNHRLATGVNAVCERPVSRSLKEFSSWQDCRDAALDSAAEQLSRSGVAVRAN